MSELPIKKIVFAVVIVAAFGGYVLYERSMNTTTAPIVATTPTPVATTPTPEPITNTPPPTPTVPDTTSTAPVVATYKDGEYSGNVANAFFGPLQVKATISGGKLTDIQYPQFPNDRPRTVEISTDSLPKLKTEAIAKQGTPVDIISGATQTSDAFNESLANALAQAKA